MQCIAIKLDENQILKDNIIDLDKANKLIDDAFKSEHCFVYKEQFGIKFWTRHEDSKDFSKLWEIQLGLKDLDWFKYYVSVWESIELDDNGVVLERADIIDKWIKVRPGNPQ